MLLNTFWKSFSILGALRTAQGSNKFLQKYCALIILSQYNLGYLRQIFLDLELYQDWDHFSKFFSNFIIGHPYAIYLHCSLLFSIRFCKNDICFWLNLFKTTPKSNLGPSTPNFFQKCY